MGIDLGTTNCALAYVDTHAQSPSIAVHPIPQLTDAGEVTSLETLPSFLYLPANGEFNESSLRLPWKTGAMPGFVGVWAREHGAQTSGRLVASAKSWLCHTQVDRTARLLPWHGAPDVTPVSPVEAAAAYLKHLRSAWDHRHPDTPLAEQDIVLTLPASFDEIARELTVEAAKLAGLQRVVLIEEPQAAFYDWIDRHVDDWSDIVQPGQVVLVCDVGGGTSDFTLIHARPDASDANKVTFHRIAVGEHLILGGDNLDLALAKHLESRLSSAANGATTLTPRAWDVLLRKCRRVKEQLLTDDAPESIGIHLPGSGSKLLQGGVQVEARRDEARSLLLDGFFPSVEPSARVHEGASGFREFGLPFAADPRVTAYLATFLRQAAAGQSAITPDAATGMIRPDWLVFNGGVFTSPQIRDRVVAVINRWFGDQETPWRAEPDAKQATQGWRLGLLEHDRLDQAVARGAAYFGMVRRGFGVRIAAGLARSYYVGLAGDPPRAVCLVPAGTEPGPEIVLDQHPFQLRVSTPVEFPIYVSAVRLNDESGAMIDVDPQQLRSLVPIRTVLKSKEVSSGSMVPIELVARLTEIGTLELSCREVATQKHWRLQFDVRTATQTDVQVHTGEGETFGILDEATWDQIDQTLTRTFGEAAEDDPESLVKRLGAVLDESRDNWAPSTLRRIWQRLLELEQGRRPSAKHEARWLNLLGFALRPGFGIALDDWRVTETWKLLQGKLLHAAAANRTESWILWRRIAGGLSPGQQQSLAQPLLTQLRQFHRQATTGKGQGSSFDFGSHEAAEIWRLLGSLERLPVQQKLELGKWLLELRDRRKVQATRAGMLWAVGRLGARVPLYGLLNHVVPRDEVERWIRQLIESPAQDPADLLAVMQLARRCDDRFRDISDATRTAALDWLRQNSAGETLLKLVSEGGELASEQTAQVLGDSLPIGLTVAHL
ncbi:MAG: hsp70 family protein [Planctomycetales bacterium]|nr:hsp70 family protein [Planctomycetales bacterium]